LIGLVPQEAYLFSGTIGDNLRHGRSDATEEELWQALEVAQAREFVEALPQKLDAPVAQGGGNFSGGQRQRLTIARALVRRPPIYIFDDSFSALDYATEARLRAALSRHIAKDAATLIVGQRVSSLRHANRIIVLDQGVIIGAGTHDELMGTCAAYRDIVASQHADEVAS
jgi:ATP-binding cassette subfamily B protein